MAARRASAPRLSAPLRALLSPGEQQLGTIALDRRQLSSLRTYLAARPRDPEIDLARALRILAHGDPGPETARAIGAFARDRKRPLSVRLQAIASLGEIADRSASRTLGQILARHEPSLEIATLRSLAKNGDRKALEAIEADLAERDDVADNAELTQARIFTQNLIALRLGDEPSRDIDSSLSEQSEMLEFRTQTPAATARVCGALRGALYGLDASPDLGFRFLCGGVEHVLLLDRAVEPGRLVTSLCECRRLTGLIAMQDRSTGAYVARWLVLTRPDNAGVHVTVATPNGRVAVFGALRPGPLGLIASLRDYDASPVPIQVDGLITEEDVKVSARVFLRARARSRAPAAIS